MMQRPKKVVRSEWRLEWGRRGGMASPHQRGEGVEEKGKGKGEGRARKRKWKEKNLDIGSGGGNGSGRDRK